MDIKLYLFVIIGALAGFTKAGTLDRLTDDLFSNYNNFNIPDIDGIKVSHSLQLIKIVSLEDDVLTLNVWVTMSWTDKRLMWNPDDYDGIEEIRIPGKMIWLPDIVPYNSAEQFTTLTGREINAIISNYGEVTFIPNLITKTHCAVKASSVEMGRRIKCQIKFGSWTYYRAMVDIYLSETKIGTDNFVEGERLKLKSSSVVREIKKYECCPEEYVHLLYTIEVKHKQDVMGTKVTKDKE